MSWVDNEGCKCNRCNQEAMYVSYNCNTAEEYCFCLACGTVNNLVLKRNDDGNAIYVNLEYTIDGKLSFVKLDENDKVVESIKMDQTITDEMICDWGKKDTGASMERINNKQDADKCRYIIALVNEDNSFEQVFGTITVGRKDGNKIINTSYFDYEVIHVEGFGVAMINGEKGSTLCPITKDTEPEYIKQLEEGVVETSGYLTIWDEEKKELIIKHGTPGYLQYQNDDCDCGGCGSGCKCSGNCNCGGNCKCSHNEIQPE